MPALPFDRADLVGLAVGGVAGASLRWVIGGLDAVDGPWGTFVANVLGCLVLGSVIAATRHRPTRPRLARSTATGFCGSLTTFSSFAVELAERPLSEGGFYLAASLLAAAIAFGAGRGIGAWVATGQGR